MRAFCGIDLDAGVSSSAGYYIVRRGDDPYDSFSYFLLTPDLALKASSSRSSLESQISVNLSSYGGSSEVSLQNSIVSLNGKYKISSNISTDTTERIFISGKLKSVGNVTEDELRHVLTRQNSVINDWRNRIMYTLRPTKTSMHLGYSNRFISYRGDETTTTLTMNTGQVGISQAIGSRLSFQITFGFTRKSFSEDHVDFFSVPFSLVFTQMLFNRINTQASLGLKSHGYLGRRTSYLKPTVQLSLSGKILNGMTSSVSLRRTVSESSGADRHIVTNTIASGSLSIALLRSLRGSGYLSYSENDYISMGRAYRTLGINASLLYSFRKLGSLSLNYGYFRFIPEFDNVSITQPHEHYTLSSSYAISF